MRTGALATMVFAVLLALPIASMAGLAPDTDGDGVPDVLDNCLNVANAGTLDCDTDQDGYGNRCDCDLNEAGACGGPDLFAWKSAFKNQNNGNADHNCDGPVAGPDLFIWKGLFKNQLTQFTSGLSCANPNLAGSCPN